MKQIAAMISERIGQPQLKAVRIASSDPGGTDQPERPRGEHEAVGALLALLAGGPASPAALDVAHIH